MTRRQGGRVFPATVYWRKLSDHFPVGATFSEAKRDPWIEVPFAASEDPLKAGNRLVMAMLDFNEGLPVPLRFQEPAPATNQERLAMVKGYLLKCLAQAKWKEASGAIEAIQLNTEPEVARAVLARIAKALVDAQVVDLKDVKKRLQSSDVWPLAGEAMEEKVEAMVLEPTSSSAAKQEVDVGHPAPEIEERKPKRRRRRPSRSPEPVAKRFKRDIPKLMDIEPVKPSHGQPSILLEPAEKPMELETTAHPPADTPMANMENTGMQ